MFEFYQLPDILICGIWRSLPWFCLFFRLEIRVVQNLITAVLEFIVMIFLQSYPPRRGQGEKKNPDVSDKQYSHARDFVEGLQLAQGGQSVSTSKYRDHREHTQNVVVSTEGYDMRTKVITYWDLDIVSFASFRILLYYERGMGKWESDIIIFIVIIFPFHGFSAVRLLARFALTETGNLTFSSFLFAVVLLGVQWVFRGFSGCDTENKRIKMMSISYHFIIWLLHNLG